MGQAAVIRDAFGYLYPNELKLLQEFAKELPEDSVIVNIGAGAGTSGLAFVEARPDCLVYTIDIQADSSPYGSLEGERNAFAQAGLLHLLNHSWFQIHGDSKVVGASWRDRVHTPIDLLFIDGNHDYEGCAGDIKAWLPHLVNGAVVALHDFGKAENDPTADGRTKPYPGVDKAVKELLIDPGYPVAGHVDTLIAFRKEVL